VYRPASGGVQTSIRKCTEQYQEGYRTTSRGEQTSNRRCTDQYQEGYRLVSGGVQNSIRRCTDQYQEVYGTGQYQGGYCAGLVTVQTSITGIDQEEIISAHGTNTC